MFRWVCGLLLVGGFLNRIDASPEIEVRSAVQRLADAKSYTWEVFSNIGRAVDDSTRPRGPLVSLGSSSVPGKDVLICRGVWAAETGMIISSMHPLEVTVVRVSRRHAVASTPLGWMTREEIEEAIRSRPDRIIVHARKEVSLRLSLVAARSALSLRGIHDLVIDWLKDLESFEILRPDHVVAAIGRHRVERQIGLVRGNPNGPNLAPEDVEGRVIFRLQDGVLHEMEVRFIHRDTLQKSETFRINSIDNTTVVPPTEAFERLLTLTD